MKYSDDKILGSFGRLYAYCKENGYQGWDNFDGLNSRQFRKSVFYSSAFLRLAWTQLFKRSPVNFRRIAAVPKGYNAKGLALFASGLVYCGRVSEARELLEVIMRMTCSGYGCPCWGYNFDWQARRFLTPVGTPNTVVTVFVVNALLDYFDSTQDEDIFDLAKSACDFYLEHLILHEDNTALCFGYMPGCSTRVHNVNMLGAAALARIYRTTRNRTYYEKSRKAMTYSMRALEGDCSWPYGEDSSQSFKDNFHTGFNLVALRHWMDYTGEETWEDELKGAYAYFINTFWHDNGCPKYYHNRQYPIDIHCSAMGIVACLELEGNSERALRIAEWAVDEMQNPTGYFHYQKNRCYTNKIPYIRWSQAWMFYALGLLLKTMK